MGFEDFSTRDQVSTLTIIIQNNIALTSFIIKNYHIDIIYFTSHPITVETLASTGFKKSTPLKCIDLDVKQVKVNLISSFEQTWKAQHPQCYIPSLKVISLLVLEKIFKGFLPYMGVVAILVM